MSLVTHDYRCYDKTLECDYRLVKYWNGTVKFFINGLLLKDFDKDIRGNPRPGPRGGGMFEDTLAAWRENPDVYVLETIKEF